MNTEIKCRKPKPIKYFGIANLYERYTNRYYKWRSLLPSNGDTIRITWMPDNRGDTNAYIGFEGRVEKMNIEECVFLINSGDAILICFGNFDYIKI